LHRALTGLVVLLATGVEFGIYRFVGILLFAAFLVPVSLTLHNFWKLGDPQLLRRLQKKLGKSKEEIRNLIEKVNLLSNGLKRVDFLSRMNPTWIELTAGRAHSVA
jgi:hypothetical protein